MASSFTASAPNSSITILHKRSPLLQPFAVLGLPAMSKTKGKMIIKCEMEMEDGNKGSSAKTKGVALLAAASAAALSSPAIALVDERMSTEGIGLPFGLSNNLLGWILLGVFGLIWTLYTVYTGTLDEDDDSGLSL
ncbi:photosystem II reaction center W protein, chloroplastic-like [Impatiens glandulifera]|uniref:photosystem II reaction center W protein, chloroplastic-like n=1 Tax=Impatiens glandulifera TaxID=253017 RepID=UPI001FB18D7B|nr:photosystem II reaction center W protein, chloroplastic-like [Impatiens glandulifera]